MKESEKRENSYSKKKKHGRSSFSNLESWDQTDLEDADEKVLEKRLHQLRMQLQMAPDDGSHESRHGSSRKHKKRVSEEAFSSDSDSSDSDGTLSSSSSLSVPKHKNKKSSSFSDDDRRKYQHSPTFKRKSVREYKISRNLGRNERENTINPKADKKIIFRKKTSLALDKHASRKKSPSLDRREIYSRVDTGRWHEKAKEFGKERNKRDAEHDRSRTRGRSERNRSISMSHERVTIRSKEERMQKKVPSRGTAVQAARRKESPESIRTRIAYDSVRRTAVLSRKLSPRDERTGRHDERRLDLKVTRRNDVRPADLRDVNVRLTREARDRGKELPVKVQSEKPRDREIISKSHRDIVEHGPLDVRDRSRLNEERFKDRDKRLHERLESERNVRGVRHSSRDSVDDKFRRTDRPVEVNRGGGVFDRMRNRYSDRRNAENNQKLGRDRLLEMKKDRPLEKETLKSRSVDTNGADRLVRDRRPAATPGRGRSPLHRERKEPERNVIERRSPVPFGRKFSSPSNLRKARDPENHVVVKRRSTENDDPQWNKKKCPNEVRSRSRSSEKRRRRSSQEEWRVIDMTSPVLDDEFSDENGGTHENNGQNKLRRSNVNKTKQVAKDDDADESETSKQNKTILTDELSDISDEDFNDVNATNISKIKKDVLSRNDRLTKNDKPDRKPEQKFLNDQMKFDTLRASIPDIKDTINEVDVLIDDQKLPDAHVSLEKVSEDLDSDEETDLFTVSRVSDALGVDWADLVGESKRRIPNMVDEGLGIRKRWSAESVFARIGLSEKYVGKNLFSEIQKDLLNVTGLSDNLHPESNIDDEMSRFWHKVSGLHVCLKNKASKRRMLFEPYKTAISARKDITIRRRLCGLPVKYSRTQQIMGLCHWIV